MGARITFLQHSDSDVPGLLGALAGELGLDVTVSRPDRQDSGLPRADSFDLLVVMGSIESVYDRSVPWIAPERALVSRAVDDGKPVLGICFGGQLLADVLGGTVTRASRTEIGWGTVDTLDPGRIGPGPWLNWHDDAFTCPPGAEALATSSVSLQAFVDGPHTGVQFHPEVTRSVVDLWIDDARDRDGVTDVDASALLAGFDADGFGPVDQTRMLLDGFLTRADALN